MLFALAAALALSPAPADPPTTRVVAQARASVRIISGARVKLDGSNGRDGPAAHEAVVHTEGKPRGARLIEFQ